MSMSSNIHEPTKESVPTPIEKNVRPWRARDAAVRDAAARFVALLDDVPGQSEDGQPLPDRREASDLPQGVLHPEPHTPEDAFGEAKESKDAPRGPRDQRPSAAERRDVARQSDERTTRAGGSPDYRAGENGIVPIDARPTTTIPTTGTGVDAAAQFVEGGALDAVCREIADRVLVSSPMDSSTTGEVRLLIRDNVLPQTEVRISRQAGELHVSIITGSAESYALLAGHKQLLDDRLAERLGGARVDVALDPDRRNDNRQGRSRGRRSVFDEEEGRT